MEESKCIICKNLFVATAKDENGKLFSRSSCLVDSKCFDLLWEKAQQVFTGEVGDAAIPAIVVCSHWVVTKFDNFTPYHTWGTNHMED
jgi:hypothetical protein